MLAQRTDYRISQGYSSNLIMHNNRDGMINVVVEHNWDENTRLKNFILNESDNGTLFHRPLFLQYHDKNKFQDTECLKLSFYKKGRLVAFIAGAVQMTENERRFISPFGSSYGGLVFHKELSFKEIEDVYFELLNNLQKHYAHIKISSTPVFQSKTGKSQYVEHILLNKGFVVTKSDIILVHELDSDEKLPSRIDKKTFTELKQPLFKNKLRLEIAAGVDEEGGVQAVRLKQRERVLVLVEVAVVEAERDHHRRRRRMRGANGAGGAGGDHDRGRQQDG